MAFPTPRSVLVPRLPEGPYYGVLAQFRNAKELYHACERVRDAGYKHWDAHTPYPVHGLERAMGIRQSWLPWIPLVTGITGATVGMGLQGWVHTTAYPMVISGKPLFSWQAFIPVTFEITVLFAALGAVLGMLAINQLPTFYHPLFSSRAFEKVTDNGLFVSIESWDPRFDEQKTTAFLKDAGAIHVELVPSGNDTGNDSDASGE